MNYLRCRSGLWLPDYHLRFPERRGFAQPRYFLPGHFPTGVVAKAAPDPDLTGAYVTSGDEGATLSIGSEPGEDERRFIVVVAITINTGGESIPTSPTIGGNAATIAVRHYASIPADPNIVIYYAEVASGTTAVIDTDWAQDISRVHVYRLIVTENGGLSVTDSDEDDTGTSLSFSLDITEGGFAIGGAQNVNAASWSWTNLSVDVNDNINSNEWSSAASDSFTAAQTGLSISADTSDNNITIGAVASFEPVAA